MPKQASATFVAIDVNHGDAILIDWRGPDRRWTCLIDGGKRAIKGDPVGVALRDLSVEKIDLMIASHLDSDHVAGLCAIARRTQVDTYWGPALPAFRRHRWLFGARCQEALERGEELESILVEKGTTIMYPMEGYRSRVPDGPTIEIASPAGRLIHRLLTRDDVSELFTSSPMSLGWLLQPEEDEEDEEEPLPRVQLRSRIATGALEPNDIPPELAAEVDARGDARALAEEWARSARLEPEFFGDPVFNDTSLVVWMELPTGARRHRLLLPGDQENWTYLYARHPRGLQADVLKASHHGGRVYLENDETHEELM